jgi:hypothetical protein
MFSAPVFFCLVLCIPLYINVFKVYAIFRLENIKKNWAEPGKKKKRSREK